MMKKFVVTLLLLLYLIPTFGVNVAVHYCGGEISSIFFGSTTADKCACGSKKMKKNCCRDKNFSFEVDDDQSKTQVVDISFLESFNIQAVLPKAFLFDSQYISLVTEEDYFYHPPNNVKQSLYILHQVFRI